MTSELSQTFSQTLSPRNHFKTACLCSLANFVSNADRVVMPIAIIQLANELEYSMHTQAWIHSVFSVGYLGSQLSIVFSKSSSPDAFSSSSYRTSSNSCSKSRIFLLLRTFGITRFFRWLCWALGFGTVGQGVRHRPNTKWVLLYAILLCCSCTFFTPLAAQQSLFLLLLSRFMLGVAEGIGLPTIYAIFTRRVPPAERGRAFGWLLAAASAGQTIASLSTPHLRWEHAFLLWGCLGYLWAPLWILWERDSGGGVPLIEGRAGYRVLAQSDELDPDIETGTVLSVGGPLSSSAASSGAHSSGHLVELDLGASTLAPAPSAPATSSSTSRLFLSAASGDATDADADGDGDADGHLNESDERLVESAVAQLRQGAPALVSTNSKGSIGATTGLSSPSLAWHSFFTHSALWAIYCAHFASNWLNYIIASWLPFYLHQYLHADNTQIMLTCMPYLCNSVGAVAFGHLSDWIVRSRRMSLLQVRRTMTAIGLLIPAVLTLLVGSTQLVSVSMFFSAACGSGHLANHAEVAPRRAAASRTFALSNALATCAGIAGGPITAALVLLSHSWHPVFLVAALVAALGAVIYATHASDRPCI